MSPSRCIDRERAWTYRQPCIEPSPYRISSFLPRSLCFSTLGFSKNCPMALNDTDISNYENWLILSAKDREKTNAQNSTNLKKRGFGLGKSLIGLKDDERWRPHDRRTIDRVKCITRRRYWSKIFSLIWFISSRWIEWFLPTLYLRMSISPQEIRSIRPPDYRTQQRRMRIFFSNTTKKNRSITPGLGSVFSHHQWPSALSHRSPRHSLASPARQWVLMIVSLTCKFVLVRMGAVAQ